MIGNSSSGIIEVPSLSTMTVNIGDRQTGRVKGNSIIDVRCNKADIIAGVDKAMNNAQEKIINPYLKENSALLYYKTTITILGKLTSTKYKSFYDLR